MNHETAKKVREAMKRPLTPREQRDDLLRISKAPRIRDGAMVVLRQNGQIVASFDTEREAIAFIAGVSFGLKVGELPNE